MKSFLLWPFCIFLLFVSIHSKGQDVEIDEDLKKGDIEEVLKIEINKLHAQKYDSIISFTLPYFYMGHIDFIGKIGKVITSQYKYLLFRKGNKEYIKKLVQYMDHNANSQVVVSLPITLKNDSLFSWLRLNMKVIIREEIYPYIFKLDSVEGDYYDYVQYVSHPSYYSIRIYTIAAKGDCLYKSIREDYLEKQSGSLPPNVNYKYNINTRLYLLFVMLKKQCEALDGTFEFLEAK